MKRLSSEFRPKTAEVVLDRVWNKYALVGKENGRPPNVTFYRNEGTDKTQNQRIATEYPVTTADLEPIGLSVIRGGVKSAAVSWAHVI